MKAKIAAALRAAYVGPETMAALRARFNLSASTIGRFWAAERRAGRIVDVPRPHFAQHIAAPCDPVDDDDAADIDLDDDTPIAGPLGLRLPDPDPLLAALRAAHGGDCWRHLDGMAAQVLAAEAAGRGAATRVLCLRLCRRRDAILNVLLRRQAAFAVRAVA